MPVLRKQGFRVLINFLLLIGVSSIAYSQDIDNSLKKLSDIGKLKPVKITGGLNFGSAFYNMQGMPSRRPPFTWNANANLNFKIFETVDLNFSLNYNSGGQLDVANPNFSEIIKGMIRKTGISPKYKAVTLHIGERSLNFSQNTYAGIPFYGLGIEVKPTKSLVNFAAFEGLLQRRIMPDSLISKNTIVPAYERSAWGAKVNFQKSGQNFSLIGFHAADNVASLGNLSPVYNVKPEENLVLGIETKNKITKRIDVQLEYVASAFTPDLRAPARDGVVDFSYFNNMGRMFTPLLSTRYNKALKTGINYKADIFTFGGEYKRVDPTFVTLGSTSAKNDFEAFTFNNTLNLFKSKLTLASNIGTERNNLENLQALSMHRFIWSVNANYNATKQLMFSGTYSNFNHSTAPSLINFVDTIKLMQINENSNLMAVYNWGSNTKQTLMLNASFQKTQDVQEYDLYRSTVINTVNNYVLNYNMNFVATKMSVATSVIYTDVISPDMKTTSLGPSLTLTKKMLNNAMNINGSFGYFTNKGSGSNETSNTINSKLGLKYNLLKKHSLKLDATMVKRINKTNSAKSFTEYQVKIAYSYTF